MLTHARTSTHKVSCFSVDQRKQIKAIRSGPVGIGVGSSVGVGVGTGVGMAVGIGVGAGVGAGVGDPVMGAHVARTVEAA